MANSQVSGVRIAGVASAVPAKFRTIEDEGATFGQEQATKVSQYVGIKKRRIVPKSLCTSDLCVAAAERLLDELGWKREEIVGLIFITQTPDYVLPATSYSIHRRLGLASSCFVFDVNLGCSGYVYGLWMASSLMQTAPGKVLLLVGDTSSRVISPQDQSVAFLFGDAGTATALEPSATAAPIHFELGSDGSGDTRLMIPAGGFRYPRNQESGIRSAREDVQNVRSDEDLYMDGPAVFTFTLQRVPGLVKSILKHAGRDFPDIDGFVFHQANRFMLDHLAKRLKIPQEKFIVSMQDYGNTSSASIPLTLTTSDLRSRLQSSSTRLLLAGFGVGFSWAGAIVETDSLVMPELVECAEPEQALPPQEVPEQVCPE